VSRWEATLFLEPKSEVPIFRQIAQALTDEIRCERFRPGDHLPGYRTVAGTAGVHLLTATHGYGPARRPLSLGVADVVAR